MGTDSVLDQIQHPAIIFLAAVGLCWLRQKFFRTEPPAWPTRFMRVAAILLVAVYLGMMLIYLLKPGYWDPIEPSVTVVAQQLRQGRQIYHASDAMPRYSLLYGPSIFMSNAAALSIVDNPILASKLSGVCWAIAALIAAYLALRRSFDGDTALTGSGLIAGLALWYEHYTYWNRADSLLFFCASAGLLSILIDRKWLSWLILSLAIGVAMNTKIHAALYFIPLITLLYIRRGWRACIPPILLTAVWISVPFVFFPQLFSLPNYLIWLMDVSSLPPSVLLLGRNLEYGFMLAFIPALFVWAAAVCIRNLSSILPLILPVVVCMGCMAAAVIIGANPGAGPHHFIPLIPLLVYLTADANSKAIQRLRVAPGWLGFRAAVLSTLIPAWLIASAATIVIGQIQIGFYDFLLPDESPIQSDLLSLRAKYAADTLQMGYGDDNGHRATYFRPWLYTDNHEYFLDSMAMMDMQAAGIQIPIVTVAAFQSQQFDVWLVPRGDQPFSMHNLWFGSRLSLFSPGLQQAFLDNYTKVDHSQFYDVWQAKRLVSADQLLFRGPDLMNPTFAGRARRSSG